MYKELKERKIKYHSRIEKINSAFVFTMDSAQSIRIQKARVFSSELNFKLLVFIKRYFYKLFIDGNRSSNKKIPFKGNMILLQPKENCNFLILKKLKRIGLKLEGVIHNSVFDKNYGIYVASKFNPHRAIIVMLKTLVMILVRSIKNLEKI